MLRVLKGFSAWSRSPWGVLWYAFGWLLLTHWGGSLWVVSWGSMLVLLGLSTLLRSLAVIVRQGWGVIREHGPGPLALLRSSPGAVQRHGSAARAYIDKLREDEDGEVSA